MSRVLDAVRDCDGTGVSELSDYLNISKSTAYIHLRTLEENGLIVQRGNCYRFVFKFTVLGEYARNQNPLYRYGKPEAEKFVAETDQYTHIVTEENGYEVNLYQAKGDTSIDGKYQTEKAQSQDHLHYAASGKTVLVVLPDEQVEKIIEQRGLPVQMKVTITDHEALFDEPEQIRERGYTYDDEEETRGFCTIGASIEDPSGQVPGSVSVSGPTSLPQDEQFQEHVPKLVMQSANVIEVNISINARSQSMGRDVCNVRTCFQAGVT